MTLTASNISAAKSGKTILSDVSLEVEPGRLTALIGPNGAGKSTLMKIVAGEESPGDGTVMLAGRSIDEFKPAELARIRSVMTQSSHVIFDFLVEEIISLGWVHESGQTKMIGAVEFVVRQCGIDYLVGRVYRTLSGGEKQRVQFARALLQIWSPAGHAQPKYMLLDEPTSSLDVAHELELLKYLKQLAGGEIGVLVVLHDLNLASHFADEVLLINDGNLIEKGTPEDVMQTELLTQVYGTHIEVEYSQKMDRLVIYTH